MPVVRTFISHATKDKPRVLPLLRKAAPYGVGSWLDAHDLLAEAGSSLRGKIMGVLRDPAYRSLSVFLSEESVRSGWVNDEVGEALAQVPDGYRVIPIALDPIQRLDLPPAIEPALRRHGDGFDTLYLDASVPERIPELIPRWAASVLRAGGAREARDVVLHLGHRHPRDDAAIPDPWAELPAIDLRLHYPAGNADFSPTEEEWSEIRGGLDFLAQQLKAQRIRVCGFAPLGVAAAVGKTWDRGTGVSLEGWNVATRQVWTSTEAILDAPWSPEKSRHLKVEREGNYFSGHDALVVAFVSSEREDYIGEVRRWNARRPQPAPPALMVRTPARINSPTEASEVLAECASVLPWLRARFPQFRSFDLIATLPLPLVAFLAHRLRQVGMVRYYDKIMPPCEEIYRLALSWG